MTRNDTLKIADELGYHVRVLVQEAQQGDESAREWLQLSFPGHTALFNQIWRGERPHYLVVKDDRKVRR